MDHMDLQLFGGLFGSKSKSTTTTTPYSGQYADWINSMYGTLTDNLNNQNKNVYPGQLSIGMTDTQNRAINSISGLLNNPTLTDTMSGKYVDVSSNPYLQGYADQIKQNIAESWASMMDGINSAFARNGIYDSSARTDQLNKAAKNLATVESNALNNLYGSAYNTERQNQLGAINQAGGLANTLFGAGTTEQGINQSGLDKQYAAWLTTQGLNQQDLGNLLTLLQMVKNPSSTTTTESSGLGGAMAGLLTGIGTGIGKNIKWGR